MSGRYSFILACLSSWLYHSSAAESMRHLDPSSAAMGSTREVDGIVRGGRTPSVGPVVVSGATGRTGALTYLALRDAGVEVRALVRNASKARELLDCGRCGEDEVRHLMIYAMHAIPCFFHARMLFSDDLCNPYRWLFSSLNTGTFSSPG